MLSEIRSIVENDYEKELFQLLNQLTQSNIISKNEFIQKINEIKKTGDVFVIEDIEQKKIVASGKLLIEQKLIRGGSKVGHLEDIIVHSEYRKYGLGKIIVNFIVNLAKNEGCYKIIGDCNDNVINFYLKLGFEKKGNQIAIYF